MGKRERVDRQRKITGIYGEKRGCRQRENYGDIGGEKEVKQRQSGIAEK